MTLRRAIDYYVQAGEISRAIAVATDPHISAEGATDAATIRQIYDHAGGSLEEGRLLARWERQSTSRRAITERRRLRLHERSKLAAAERDAGLEPHAAYATSVDHFDLRWSEVLAKSRRIRELARRVDDPRSETYARIALPLR